MQAINLEANFEKFLSTPSARRATGKDGSIGLSVDISIHALREEGDVPYPFGFRIISPISIHALREEGDIMTFPLSTGPLYFYPRPPRGGRPWR